MFALFYTKPFGSGIFCKMTASLTAKPVLSFYRRTLLTREDNISELLSLLVYVFPLNLSCTCFCEGIFIHWARLNDMDLQYKYTTASITLLLGSIAEIVLGKQPCCIGCSETEVYRFYRKMRYSFPYFCKEYCGFSLGMHY